MTSLPNASNARHLLWCSQLQGRSPLWHFRGEKRQSWWLCRIDTGQLVGTSETCFVWQTDLAFVHLQIREGLGLWMLLSSKPNNSLHQDTIDRLIVFVNSSASFGNWWQAATIGSKPTKSLNMKPQNKAPTEVRPATQLRPWSCNWSKCSLTNENGSVHVQNAILLISFWHWLLNGFEKKKKWCLHR